MPNPMNIVPPVPGTTPGPQWAQEINTILEAQVAPHTHTGSPDGSQLTQAALNINGSLNLNNNALINTKYVELDAETSVVSAGSIYRLADGNLYYRNGGGTQVQITAAGSLVPTTATGQGIIGLTAPASADYTGGVFTWRLNAAGNQYAEMWNAGIKVFNGAVSNPAGAVVLANPHTLTSDKTLLLPPNSLTLPQANPATKSFVRMTTAGVMTADISQIQKYTLTNLASTNWATETFPDPAGTLLADFTFTGTGDYPLEFLVVPQVGSVVSSACVTAKGQPADPATKAIMGKLVVKIANNNSKLLATTYKLYDPDPTSPNTGAQIPPAFSAFYVPSAGETTAGLNIKVYGMRVGGVTGDMSLLYSALLVKEII